MYSHRHESRRVEVVDLDPYGTAAPFIDAAVQCVKDDGRASSDSGEIELIKKIFRSALCYVH
jgi:tRNA (guanine26-N2/guanine27-N2)-dimethyltransferase